VSAAWPGRSTYSGRAIDAGTGRRGETTPGATLPKVTGMAGV
jgi:hypothetical protein